MNTISNNSYDSPKFAMGGSSPLDSDHAIISDSPRENKKPLLQQTITKSAEVFSRSLSIGSLNSVKLHTHQASSQNLTSSTMTSPLSETTLNSMTSSVTQRLHNHPLGGTSIVDSKPAEPAEILNYSKKGYRYNTPEGQRDYVNDMKSSAFFKQVSEKRGYDGACELLLNKIPTSGEKLIIKSGVDQAVSEIESKLDDKGLLGFTIRTISKDGKHRGPIPGKSLFDEMMLFHGDSVKAIEANWYHETNLKTFNSEVELREKRFQNENKRNADENELNAIYLAAAKVTWTGTQAARYGYSPKSVEFPMDDRKDGVTVLFSRD